MGQTQTNPRYYPIRLGVLFKLDGFLGLPAPIRALLLRLVVRVRFLVVVAALPAEKEQNLLSVGAAHADSFRIWRVVVKRITLATNG
jgi:hypothetical protein